MKTIRFGVVGAQGIGGSHIRGIRNAEGAELTALCDVKPEAKAQAEELGVAYYESFEALTASDSIDAVCVCVPHALHHPVAISALRNGKHVMVEKPIAVTVREADEMIDLAKANGLKLGVMHQYRTRPANRAAKQAIEEGRTGEILRVVWTHNAFRTNAYYASGKWRGTWKMEGGGALINQTVHDLDLLCWLVGEPVEVTALAANLAHETIEVEDIASAAIRFRNGALASVQLDVISVPGMEMRVIAGDKGTLDLTGAPKIGIPKAGVFQAIRGDYPPFENGNEIAWEDLPLDEAPGSHDFVIQDFADAIREDRAPFVTGEEGRRALELVNSILYSGLTGRAVKLPLDRDAYDRLMNDLIEGRVKINRPDR